MKVETSFQSLASAVAALNCQIALVSVPSNQGATAVHRARGRLGVAAQGSPKRVVKMRLGFSYVRFW